MVDRFNVSGKTAVVTGGGGILCSEMAIALAGRGVKVAILDINETQAKAVADRITAEGGEAIAKDTGEPTERGREIIGHTPMGKYGVPEDLLGTLLWLVSDASSFVNGVVVPVDGAFSAFSGV